MQPVSTSGILKARSCCARRMPSSASTPSRCSSRTCSLAPWSSATCSSGGAQRRWLLVVHAWRRGSAESARRKPAARRSAAAPAMNSPVSVAVGSLFDMLVGQSGLLGVARPGAGYQCPPYPCRSGGKGAVDLQARQRQVRTDSARRATLRCDSRWSRRRVAAQRRCQRRPPAAAIRGPCAERTLPSRISCCCPAFGGSGDNGSQDLRAGRCGASPAGESPG